MMSFWDWMIVIVPTLFVLGMGLYSRRYLRDVTTFLSAGRVCGRYVISVGDVASSLSIIGLLSYVEIHYKTGFATTFWTALMIPLTVALGLFGYVTYRFRETKSQSIGQFLEMRYSRGVRIFAAGLRSISEMLANMIMPALAARFFIYFLDLPHTFSILGFEISTFHFIMIMCLFLAISIICMGGAMSIIITDTIQGFICYPMLVFLTIFILVKFPWNSEMLPVMADRVSGESFIDPTDISKLKDFNLFSLMLLPIVTSILQRASWIGCGGSSTAARSPHEQKMATLLGTWRQALGTIFYVLVAVALLTMLNHHNHAEEAHKIRLELSAKVASEVVSDKEVRAQVIASMNKIPVQKHVIGKEAPLSDKSNIDTRYLNVAHKQLQMSALKKVHADNPDTVKAVITQGKNIGETAEKNVIEEKVFSHSKTLYDQLAAVSSAAGQDKGEETQAKHVKSEVDSIANPVFAKFRTLYYQLMLPVTLRNMLPKGMLGMFCLLMVLLMVSTDDTRIFSATVTVSQDVILPLRKKQLTPREHMWMVRWVAIGIGIFFFLGSSFMSQLDYISLFVALMCTMWLGGCGPVLIFGLYSRFGTTAGAWTSLLTGVVMGLLGMFVQRNWADLIYPFLCSHGWDAVVGEVLQAVSRPFEPWIEWRMNAVRCPINSYEWYFITMITTLLLYCIVSWCTCKEKFNLDRMLHRGKYALDGERKIKTEWSFRTVFSKLLGITPEYTTGDKVIAWSYFIYSFIYRFGLTFILVIIWNVFTPWTIEYWSWYFLITILIVPGIMAAVTAVWFGIGGPVDLVRMFRDLEKRTINVLDDGRVEGNMSLADKAQLEAIDRAEAAKDNK